MALRLLEHEVKDVQNVLDMYAERRRKSWAGAGLTPMTIDLVLRIGEIYDGARAREIRETLDVVS